MLYGEVAGYNYLTMFGRFYSLHEIDGVEAVELILVVVNHEWKI